MTEPGCWSSWLPILYILLPQPAEPLDSSDNVARSVRSRRAAQHIVEAFQQAVAAMRDLRGRRGGHALQAVMPGLLISAAQQQPPGCLGVAFLFLSLGLLELIPHHCCPPFAALPRCHADAEWVLQELFGCQLADDGLLRQLSKREAWGARPCCRSSHFWRRCWRRLVGVMQGYCRHHPDTPSLVLSSPLQPPSRRRPSLPWLCRHA